MSLPANNTPQLLVPSINSGQAIINSWPHLPVFDGGHHPSLKRPRENSQTRRTALIKKPPPCLRFIRGGYRNFGANCHFAHAQESGAKHYGESSNHIIIGTARAGMRLCRRFYGGEGCLYGDRCRFLHEIPDKFKEDLNNKSTNNYCGTNMLNTRSDKPERFVKKRDGLNPNQVHPNAAGWKRRLCNKWEATGHCSFGLRCYFAHGPAELRSLEKHIIATTSAKDDESSSKTGPGTKKQRVPGKTCLFKWKEVERISRVYADWVDDDMPLEHGSPGEVET